MDQATKDQLLLLVGEYLAQGDNPRAIQVLEELMPHLSKPEEIQDRLAQKCALQIQLPPATFIPSRVQMTPNQWEEAIYRIYVSSLLWMDPHGPHHDSATKLLDEMESISAQIGARWVSPKLAWILLKTKRPLYNSSISPLEDDLLEKQLDEEFVLLPTSRTRKNAPPGLGDVDPGLLSCCWFTLKNNLETLSIELISLIIQEIEDPFDVAVLVSARCEPLMRSGETTFGLSDKKFLSGDLPLHLWLIYTQNLLWLEPHGPHHTAALHLLGEIESVAKKHSIEWPSPRLSRTLQKTKRAYYRSH